MKTPLLLLHLLAAIISSIITLSATALAQAPAVPNNNNNAGSENKNTWTIVPGKSIGQISLGMEHAEVLRLLGAPHRQDDLEYTPDSNGNSDVAPNIQFKATLRDDWITPVPIPISADGSAAPEQNAFFMANFVTVYLRERRVVQIEVRVPRFRTATGLSIANTALEWRQPFPHFTVTNQRFHHTSAGGWPAVKHPITFEDAIDAGIAWRYGAFGDLAPETDPSQTVDVITVHAPGKPMLIDPDGGSRFIWKDAPLRLSTDR